MTGLYEAGEYVICCPDEFANLFVDDMPLTRNDTGDYWLWAPGYFAGEVVFELESPSQEGLLTYIADIGPAQHKTGREQYVDYLTQIVGYAPALVLGTEPAQHGLGGRSATALSLWLRYARVRQFIGRYLTGLQYIIERPIVRARSRREQVALPMVRRVDGATLRQLAHSPSMIAALADNVTSDADVHEPKLDVPFHEPTFDNPANRLIARQLSDIRRLVKRLIDDLTDYVERESATETAVAPRLPRRIAYLRGLVKQLTRLARSEPFSEADTSLPSVAELNAVSSSPHYSMVHRVGVRLLRQGVSELANDEQHYLAPTWEIYEAWCFVALARQLEVQRPAYEWRLFTSPKSADLVLKGQCGSQFITLYTQLTCPSMENPNAYGYSSISKERRPDLVLEIADGEHNRYLCLDSKYSASKTRILDAMATAHIYRDSLRLAGKPPSKSLLLVPANPDALRLAEESYQESHKVGCIVLETENDAARLIKALLG